MSKLIHIWIDDNVNKVLLYNNYTEIVEYRKGNGDLVRMDCLYQGYDTAVYFYTSEQVNLEYESLFSGLEIQKAAINCPLKETTLLYILTRLRGHTFEEEGIYPTEELLVLESGKHWQIADSWLRDNYRNCESLLEITSTSEFIGILGRVGYTLDKGTDL